MIPRHIAEKLIKAGSRYPVVHLTGPRQSGKTTLAKATFPHHDYVSLEDPDQRAFASSDPRGFLARFGRASVLDEIQRVPELLSYMQGDVDRDPTPGRFILTGSEQLRLRQEIGQTLAGRVALLQLLPFSLGELEERPTRDPDKLYETARLPKAPTRTLESVLFAGLYPAIHDRHFEAHDWLANYYRTYVERDVRQILNVGDLEAFQRFVRLCAGRSGQLLNLSSMASDCGIAHSTARQWLSVLEASFLVFLLRPHHANFSKRLIKSPKLYFLDPGLLSYLLRVTGPEELMTHPARGPVFETFVLSEILKAYLNRGIEAPLHFWRDRTGHEVDIVLDTASGLVAVEAKSGRTIADDTMAGLRYWSSLAGEQARRKALVYAGDEGYERSTIAVVPWYALS